MSLYIARTYTPECLDALPVALASAADLTAEQTGVFVRAMSINPEPPVRVLRNRLLGQLVGENGVDICTIQATLDDESNGDISGNFSASRVYRLDDRHYANDAEALAYAEEHGIDTIFAAKISLILSVTDVIPTELVRILRKNQLMPHAKDPKRRTATDVAWMAPASQISNNQQSKIAEKYRINLGAALAGSLAVGPAYFDRVAIR